MAKTRSPNYPQFDLAEAIKMVQPVFKNEGRNKMARLVLADNLGYSSLNGRALTKIGTLRAYGLIDGSGDDLVVSADAITLLAAPKDSPERDEALKRCALRPQLFSELAQESTGTLSDANLRYSLVQRKFTPEAAEKAASVYRETMKLAHRELEGYDSVNGSDEPSDSEVFMGSAQAEKPHTDQERGGQPSQVWGGPSMKIVIEGRTAKIFATVDREGIQRLKAKLDALDALLEDDDNGG